MIEVLVGSVKTAAEFDKTMAECKAVADVNLKVSIEETTQQLAKETMKHLTADLEEAEKKAWDALGRYKFLMFGYWAAIWVHLNRIGEFDKPNPWSGLVKIARER